MKLTPHFSLLELCRSDTAVRLGIDNTPAPDIVENLRVAAENILEPVRMYFGIPFSPLSGYRGEAVEKAITWDKGFKTWCARRNVSRNQYTWQQYFSLKSHPRGEAFDIRLPGIPTMELYKWMRQNLKEYDQLIIENHNPNSPHSGWVHASFSRIVNRRQAFELQE